MSGCCPPERDAAFFESVEGLEEYGSGVEALVERAGFREVLAGREVLVKPNLLRREGVGINTSPEVLGAVLNYLDSVAANVVVGETDTSGRSFEHAVSGLDLDVEVRNLSESETRVVEGRHGSLELPVEVLDRVVVNVPVLKTHVLTGVTAGVKNLFGVLPERRKEVHHHRVTEVLCDLYRAVRPEVTVLDATHVMVSGGPSSGEVAWGGALGASRDSLAMDLAACREAGVPLGAAPYLRHLAGSIDVEVRGSYGGPRLEPPSLGWKQRVVAEAQRFGPSRRALRILRPAVERLYSR